MNAHSRSEPADGKQGNSSFGIEGEVLLEAVEGAVRGLYSRFPHWVLVCDPDELVQETIKRLLENDRQRLRSFDEHKSCLKTWLSRVAFKDILNLQRQQGCFLQLEEPSLTDYTSQPEQEALLFEQERAEMFLWARSRLSESQQAILDRCSRNDFDAMAVAKELGISRDRLYERKRKMIRRFQELLREYGKRKRGT